MCRLRALASAIKQASIYGAEKWEAWRMCRTWHKDHKAQRDRLIRVSGLNYTWILLTHLGFLRISFIWVHELVLLAGPEEQFFTCNTEYIFWIPYIIDMFRCYTWHGNVGAMTNGGVNWFVRFSSLSKTWGKKTQNKTMCFLFLCLSLFVYSSRQEELINAMRNTMPCSGSLTAQRLETEVA